MLFELEAVGLLSVLFVAMRIGILFYLTPMDVFGRVPRQIILFLVLGLSAVLVINQNVRLPADELTLVQVGLIGFYELCNGLAMVLGVYVAFAVFMLAGQIIDAQTGFAAALVLNPATNTQEPITGRLLQLLAVALFFTMGMHHLFIEGIVRSFSLVPLGSVVSTLRFNEFVADFGLMFLFGLVIAAPVVIILLMLDIGIAMMSRTMPQINIYFVSLPLKIGVGLVALAISLKYTIPVFEQVFMDIYQYWSDLLVIQ